MVANLENSTRSSVEDVASHEERKRSRQKRLGNTEKNKKKQSPKRSGRSRNDSFFGDEAYDVSMYKNGFDLTKEEQTDRDAPRNGDKSWIDTADDEELVELLRAEGTQTKDSLQDGKKIPMKLVGRVEPVDASQFGNMYDLGDGNEKMQKEMDALTVDDAASHKEPDPSKAKEIWDKSLQSINKKKEVSTKKSTDLARGSTWGSYAPDALPSTSQNASRVYDMPQNYDEDGRAAVNTQEETFQDQVLQEKLSIDDKGNSWSSPPSENPQKRKKDDPLYNEKANTNRNKIVSPYGDADDATSNYINNGTARQRFEEDSGVESFNEEQRKNKKFAQEANQQKNMRGEPMLQNEPQEAAANESVVDAANVDQGDAVQDNGISSFESARQTAVDTGQDAFEMNGNVYKKVGERFVLSDEKPSSATKKSKDVVSIDNAEEGVAPEAQEELNVLDQKIAQTKIELASQNIGTGEALAQEKLASLQKQRSGFAQKFKASDTEQIPVAASEVTQDAPQEVVNETKQEAVEENKQVQGDSAENISAAEQEIGALERQIADAKAEGGDVAQAWLPNMEKELATMQEKLSENINRESLSPEMRETMDALQEVRKSYVTSQLESEKAQGLLYKMTGFNKKMTGEVAERFESVKKQRSELMNKYINLLIKEEISTDGETEVDPVEQKILFDWATKTEEYSTAALMEQQKAKQTQSKFSEGVKKIMLPVERYREWYGKLSKSQKAGIMALSVGAGFAGGVASAPVASVVGGLFLAKRTLGSASFAIGTKEYLESRSGEKEEKRRVAEERDHDSKSRVRGTVTMERVSNFLQKDIMEAYSHNQEYAEKMTQEGRKKTAMAIAAGVGIFASGRALGAAFEYFNGDNLQGGSISNEDNGGQELAGNANQEKPFVWADDPGQAGQTPQHANEHFTDQGVDTNTEALQAEVTKYSESIENANLPDQVKVELQEYAAAYENHLTSFHDAGYDKLTAQYEELGIGGLATMDKFVSTFDPDSKIAYYGNDVNFESDAGSGIDSNKVQSAKLSLERLEGRMGDIESQMARNKEIVDRLLALSQEERAQYNLSDKVGLANDGEKFYVDGKLVPPVGESVTPKVIEVDPMTAQMAASLEASLADPENKLSTANSDGVHQVVNDMSTAENPLGVEDGPRAGDTPHPANEYDTGNVDLAVESTEVKAEIHEMKSGETMSGALKEFMSAQAEANGTPFASEGEAWKAVLKELNEYALEKDAFAAREFPGEEWKIFNNIQAGTEMTMEYDADGKLNIEFAGEHSPFQADYDAVDAANGGQVEEVEASVQGTADQVVTAQEQSMTNAESVENLDHSFEKLNSTFAEDYRALSEEGRAMANNVVGELKNDFLHPGGMNSADGLVGDGSGGVINQLYNPKEAHVSEILNHDNHEELQAFAQRVELHLGADTASKLQGYNAVGYLARVYMFSKKNGTYDEIFNQ